MPLACAAALATAAPAPAAIVVQRSIAGAALDMSRAQIKKQLGEPTARRRAEDLSVWTFRGQMTVVFTDGRKGATSVSTTNPKQRTGAGLGVGATRKEVRRGLRGESCSGPSCFLGTFANGSRNTIFSFGPDGRVTRVEVRRQIIDPYDQSPRGTVGR